MEYFSQYAAISNFADFQSLTKIKNGKYNWKKEKKYRKLFQFLEKWHLKAFFFYIFIYYAFPSEHRNFDHDGEKISKK
jgi:hypothetical protein